MIHLAAPLILTAGTLAAVSLTLDLNRAMPAIWAAILGSK